MPVEPTEEDVRAVDQQYGPLPEDADETVRARRYRLYQAQALIRMHVKRANESDGTVQ
jgi:hypothetical protein